MAVNGRALCVQQGNRTYCIASTQHLAMRQRCARAHATVRAHAQQPSLHTHAHAHAQRESDVRTLSLLLLLNENLKRRTGRPLLPEGADLLDATRAAESLGCAVAIVGPGSMGASQAGAAGSSSGCAAALLYANAAAAAALGVDSCSQHGTPPTVWLPECAAGCEVSATGACLAEEAVAWRPCVRSEACPDDGSRSTATDGSSTDSSKGRTCGGSSVADGVGASGSSGEHTAGASSSGELEVDRLLVCPLTAPNDSAVGLALLFDGWRYPSDGALGRPGFPRVAPAELPDQARLQAAADGVRQQADHVRELKQQQGLANQHPDVQAAVAELQRRKEGLALLEGLSAAFAEGQESTLERWLPSQ